MNVNDLLGVGISFKICFQATPVTRPACFPRYDLRREGVVIDINDLLGSPNSFKSTYGKSCTP